MCVFSGGQVGGISKLLFFSFFLVVFILKDELPKSTLTVNLSPGARFSKVPKSSRVRKAICKTPTRLLCKAGFFFSYVVKRIKIEITAKFRASRPLCFEDPKRFRSPEKFRDF